MKEKNGKKSLVDLKNFRSTRLKQLARSLRSYFGANSSSILTTSNLDVPPPIQNFINKNVCRNFVEYNGFEKEVYISAFNKILKIYYETIKNKNLLMPLGDLEGGKVYYYNNGYSTFTNSFNGKSGYLFIYFKKSNNLCDKCINYIDGVGCPEGFEEDQNEGFAVLISKISQINRTWSQPGGIYLSPIINNALNNGNATITSVINDIRSRNNNDTTPLLVYDPFNPLIFDYDLTNLSCQKDDVFYINDRLIPMYYSSFKVNQDKFLSESEAKKLIFDDFKLIGGLDGSSYGATVFFTAEADLDYKNGTIKFKQSGSSIITFRNRYFEDTENISGKGPRIYGPKYFTLKINVTVSTSIGIGTYSISGQTQIINTYRTNLIQEEPNGIFYLQPDLDIGYFKNEIEGGWDVFLYRPIKISHDISTPGRWGGNVVLTIERDWTMTLTFSTTDGWTTKNQDIYGRMTIETDLMNASDPMKNNLNITRYEVGTPKGRYYKIAGPEMQNINITINQKNTTRVVDGGRVMLNVRNLYDIIRVDAEFIGYYGNVKQSNMFIKFFDTVGIRVPSRIPYPYNKLTAPFNPPPPTISIDSSKRNDNLIVDISDYVTFETTANGMIDVKIATPLTIYRDLSISGEWGGQIITTIDKKWNIFTTYQTQDGWPPNNIYGYVQGDLRIEANINEENNINTGDENIVNVYSRIRNSFSRYNNSIRRPDADNFIYLEVSQTPFTRSHGLYYNKETLSFRNLDNLVRIYTDMASYDLYKKQIFTLTNQLRIKNTLTLMCKYKTEFKVPEIKIELLDDKTNIISLQDYMSDKNIIEIVDINDLQYKIEKIPNKAFNVVLDSNNNSLLSIQPSPGGCKLTVYNYFFDVSVNLFWNIKIPEVFFTLSTSNPPTPISTTSIPRLTLPPKSKVPPLNKIYKLDLLPPLLSNSGERSFFYVYRSIIRKSSKITFTITSNASKQAYMDNNIFTINTTNNPKAGGCTLLTECEDDSSKITFYTSLSWDVIPPGDYNIFNPPPLGGGNLYITIRDQAIKSIISK